MPSLKTKIVTSPTAPDRPFGAYPQPRNPYDVDIVVHEGNR